VIFGTDGDRRGSSFRDVSQLDGYDGFAFDPGFLSAQWTPSPWAAYAGDCERRLWPFGDLVNRLAL
jgi:hypothetical protein